MPQGVTRSELLRGLAAVVGASAAASCAPAADRGGPAVAAAADLQFALPQVLAAFQAQGGGPLRLVFGSSGAFTRQIEQGAPFEIFMSADRAYVRRLAEGGLTEGDGQPYARGRIVLFAPHGSALAVDADLADLAAALSDGRVSRLAMANPDHAPYGRAAREALIHAGLWDLAQPRLVLGENAAQAAQFAASGSAQGGLIAYALALAPEFAGRGAFALVPESFHQPLDQQMTLLKGAGAPARAFYGFLQGAAARDILARHGFVLPQAASS
ncbi:molybdate ABC transporter substrate-binding protein [Phenylobacterium sp.]|uniref:molybdate ABC transporter substrate-binding protein n=1 Tax=Phenylobacterium sp. TaxID=1871053 RepID=UPI00273000D3|nr:molybdate ABC transporter substrate-binding protein [Phenylobacterium sp.]MDP1616175.1 molybdate ABC transporter substrate-binding protein [Phenylobacterium sp.]MDP1988185.1 molybdate ABC transporter substrate-binding protein [Phenylobacterium sp.]